MEEKEKELYNLLMQVRISPDVAEYADSIQENILKEINKKIDCTARRLYWVKLSAAAAIIMGLLGISNYVSYQEGYKQQNAQLITIQNPLGLKSSVVLPDGSQVTLNAGSVITYPTAFIAAERKISIEGEVFMEVVHNTKQPFLVEIENMYVKVLGTQFNVKAYKEDDNVEVTLIDGKVQVGVEGETPVTLTKPGEQANYDKIKNTLFRKQVNFNHYTGWKDGKFYFDKITFRNVAKQLERAFNMRFRIDSEKLKETICTGDFIKGENLDQILHIITLDERIGYKITDNEVYIYEK